jgi:hypothetical protein
VLRVVRAHHGQSPTQSRSLLTCYAFHRTELHVRDIHFDRIESSGYCRKLPNPADQRSSPLELTPERRRIFAEAGAAFDEELQRLLSAAVPERTLRQFAAAPLRHDRRQPLTGLVVAAILPVFYGITSEGWGGPWRRKGRE